MIVSTLLLLSFVAGLAVRHAYADDEPLGLFCSAICTAARFPVDLARRSLAAAQSRGEERRNRVVATMSDPFVEPPPVSKKKTAAA